MYCNPALPSILELEFNTEYFFHQLPVKWQLNGLNAAGYISVMWILILPLNTMVSLERI